MNDHFEELIHDGIDQLTAGSALPADLADRARRQVRRRRHQVRAALVAGTAAAAVIAVIAATSAGPAGTASKTSMGPHPSASATLLAKIERAVASKADSAPVLEIKTTFPAGPVPMPADPFSPVQFAEGGIDRTSIMWTRGHVQKLELFDAKGKIDTASQETERGMLGTYTSVDYHSRSWWRTQDNSFVYKNMIPKCALEPLDAALPRDWAPRNLAKEIRHDIACGRITIAGRQHVDGVDAIRLVFATGHLKIPWYEAAPAITHQTIWVDANSYLPVRYQSTLTFAHAKPGSPRSVSVQCDFQWLPATRSALAKLRLIIPIGFHHHPATITVYVQKPHKSGAAHK